jgi:transcriptional regulator with XRE-family HTH domain
MSLDRLERIGSKPMLNRMRVIRKDKGMTLEDVAIRCDPPTTAQTIGRLETGQRNLSLSWIGRIAAAMAVDPSHLLEEEQTAGIPVVATLRYGAATALTERARMAPYKHSANNVIALVKSGVGEYKAGDELLCEIVLPSRYGIAVDRDVLVQLESGKIVFGRLVEHEIGSFMVIPLKTKQKSQPISGSDWLAVVRSLTRKL